MSQYNGRRPMTDQQSVQARPVGYPYTGGNPGNSQNHPPMQQNGMPQHTGPVQRTGPVQYTGPIQQSAGMPQSTGVLQNTGGMQRTGPVQRTGSYPQTQNFTGPEQAVENGEQNTGTGATEIGPTGNTGYAPELANQRSRKVYMQEDAFWQLPEESPETEDASPEAGDGRKDGINTSDRHTGQAEATGKVSALKKMLVPLTVALVLVVVALWVIYGAIFCVREITIIGNSRINTAAVVGMSGIRNGSSIYSIREDEVAAGINSNRYLIFESMEITPPSMVTIVVRERTEAAVVSYCGIDYTIDIKGMVLEKTENVTDDHNMVVFSGILAVGRTGCEVGYMLNTVEPEQKEIICRMMVEMRVLNCEKLIKTVNISQKSNLLMTTRDGYTIKLGDGENIYRKMKAMLYVREKLLTMGEYNGTIDVSIPETPAYIPSEE